MKFPYGICDFYKMMTEDYFYVDRTDRIPLIEEAGSHLLFLRPRRFGKSLLLSVLENYYDVAKADEFEKLFGCLAIGKQPTPKHHQYFVLKWDFSVISPIGEPREIQQALYRYLNKRIQDFAVYYRHLLPETIQIESLDAITSLQSLLTAVRQTPYRLYLLIDEYDNFANELMMGSRELDPTRYKALLYGEGSLKTLFKAVKSFSAGEGIDRVFITGVSPVVLSDMTSGYNIAENISFYAEFNDLCGFLEAELAAPLNLLGHEHGSDPDHVREALQMMRAFYNGYCFSHRAEVQVYNPTLALYFLKAWQREGAYPREMLDSNLAMDRGKLSYIAQLPHGGQVILDAVNASPPLNVERLADRFGVEDMLYAEKDRTFIVSLLYYFGVLTLTGVTPLGELICAIPNVVARKLYLEQIQAMLWPEIDQDDLTRAAKTFYTTGDLQPVCDFIEHHYFKVFDNRDYRWANELTIKTAFLTLLFNNISYIMDSEAAVERGYADLIMLVRPDMRQYQLLDFVMEFKYVSLPDLNLTGAAVKEAGVEHLRTLPPVQQALTDSQAKLMRYRQALAAAYGDRLRLHTYTVVALGFERLVWVEW